MACSIISIKVFKIEGKMNFQQEKEYFGYFLFRIARHPISKPKRENPEFGIRIKIFFLLIKNNSGICRLLIRECVFLERKNKLCQL